mgnify:CR=1 FL=1
MVICVVPVPLVPPVDDESLPEEVDVPSEVELVLVLVLVEDVVPEVPAVSEDVDDSVVVGVLVVPVALVVISEEEVVGALFVLDTESVPDADALIVTMAVVSAPPSSPPQATSARPTSATITTGAWTWRSAAEQNGQRLSVSQTGREHSVQRCMMPPR